MAIEDVFRPGDLLDRTAGGMQSSMALLKHHQKVKQALRGRVGSPAELCRHGLSRCEVKCVSKYKAAVALGTQNLHICTLCLERENFEKSCDFKPAGVNERPAAKTYQIILLTKTKGTS